MEIAHEALLRTWEPLKGWIAESQEELLQRPAGGAAGRRPPSGRRAATAPGAGAAGGAGGGRRQRGAGGAAGGGRRPWQQLLADGSKPAGGAPGRGAGAGADRRRGAPAGVPGRRGGAGGAAAAGGGEPGAAGPAQWRSGSARSDREGAGGLAVQRGAGCADRGGADAATLDPAKVQGLVEQTQRQVAEAIATDWCRQDSCRQRSDQDQLQADLSRRT